MSDIFLFSIKFQRLCTIRWHYARTNFYTFDYTDYNHRH